MSAKKPVTFFEYAGCSTCRKAKKWLEAHGVAYSSVPIVERAPPAALLAKLVAGSKLPLQKWFKASGQSYRALVGRVGKEGLAKLPDVEKLRLLAADGKMIKRPVLVSGDDVLVGFDESSYGSLR